MLSANMSCLALFIVLALIGYNIYPNVYTIALSTFIIMLFRCYASEIYLQRKLKKHFDIKLVYEIFLLMLFVVTSALYSIYWSFIIYFPLCLIYLWIERTRIRETAMILLKKKS
jgi:hypothetical protein